MRLDNKIAVVTGATGGLGQAIARQLARDGASLLLVARDETTMVPLADSLLVEQQGALQQFFVVRADLSNPADVDRIADHCITVLGGVDILVNNAAVQGPIGPLETADWQQWRQSFDVNFFAPARLCQLLIPAMKKRGGGKIINISGGGATGPRPDFSAYAAAKCALVRLTETLAEELKADHIDVNAVAPGAMNTRMLEQLLAAGPQAASREYADALRRRREGGTPPEKAAALVALLASSLTDGITGKLISAVWDDWEKLPEQREALAGKDLYTLRRVGKPRE